MYQRLNVPISELQEMKMATVKWLKTQPIARNTRETNDRIYESDIDLWKLRLGPALKFSVGHWPGPSVGPWSLAEAEVAMLEIYIERAQIRDGMDILDLG
jgi:cyclopropane fatty-acyl-phospholipid synthase-like methyltransferase